jgi:3-deoxy-7-phosphoheptulonate synthase
MIIVLNNNAKLQDVEQIEELIAKRDLNLTIVSDKDPITVGLTGIHTKDDLSKFERLDIVDQVIETGEPYKLPSRKFHPEDSILNINGVEVGNHHWTMIGGPCSVESEEQILSIARDVKTAGASFLRGGAFKPRTSPYAFQGLGLDGLELLKQAREKTGLPIVTELMSEEYLQDFADDVDIIQIGARNMQNFSLLKKVGQLGKPVLLKRALSGTMEELLLATEYLMAGGLEDIILCERGIRTYEKWTRNTLDLSMIPVLREKTHLPLFVDPSHSSGHWKWVQPMSLAAAAAGADGLIIEVHNNPPMSLCDAAQAITPQVFLDICNKTKKIRDVLDY